MFVHTAYDILLSLRMEKYDEKPLLSKLVESAETLRLDEDVLLTPDTKKDVITFYYSQLVG